MKITELEIELDGITGTITNYTRNPYVVGYLNSLKKYVIQQNTELIKVSVSKLLEWYQKNFKDIMSSEYVFNKNDHILTNKFLQRVFNELS